MWFGRPHEPRQACAAMSLSVSVSVTVSVSVSVSVCVCLCVCVCACVCLHGFYRFSQFVADMCMGLMHFPRFVNGLHGFY